MQEKHLPLLQCPKCILDLQLNISEKIHQRIKTGNLTCSSCKTSYPIMNFIPRFVPLENYASNFGLEWNLHSRTQYDGSSKTSISLERFKKSTQWPDNLKGEIILEAGSGSGRFTEHALKTNATVVSFDYSEAVEANYKSNGQYDNLLLVQASIYEMPLKPNSFDKVFCIGVLQHTPDPKKSMDCLKQTLKPNGSFVVDFYKTYTGLKGFLYNLLTTKHWVRPIANKISPPILYKLCFYYVSFMWPLSKLIHKIPKIGKSLNWFLLIADYRGKYDLSEDQLKEWAILDTFDMLSPQYDCHQTIPKLQKWLEELNMKNIYVGFGGNGVEARAIK